VPYVHATSPLNSYLKPGQSKPAEFLAIRPNGILPVIQVASPSGSFDPAGEIVTNCWRICEFLLATFPEHARMPRTRVRGAYAKTLMKFAIWLSETSYREEYFAPMMDDLETMLRGDAFNVRENDADRPWVNAFRKQHYEDDADGDEVHFGGDIRNGPFLFGRFPSMVDTMLLPWLERAEALRRGGLEPRRWPSVTQMMSAAREPGVCAYSDIGQDVESLHAISYRRNQRAPPLWDISTVIARTRSLAPSACGDAAARVCANFAPIATFALRGAGAGSERRDAEWWTAGASNADAAAATEDSLRIVVALLLGDVGAQSGFQMEASQKQALAVCRTHGAGAGQAASAALNFLAWNIGVPRDMAAPCSAGLCRACGRTACQCCKGKSSSTS